MRRRGRNNGIRGNGGGQRPMWHRPISILDEDNDLIERKNVKTAIGGATSRERVVAVTGVFRPEALREIMRRSPHTDSQEIAKRKLEARGDKP